MSYDLKLYTYIREDDEHNTGAFQTRTVNGAPVYLAKRILTYSVDAYLIQNRDHDLLVTFITSIFGEPYLCAVKCHELFYNDKIARCSDFADQVDAISLMLRALVPVDDSHALMGLIPDEYCPVRLLLKDRSSKIADTSKGIPLPPELKWFGRDIDPGFGTPGPHPSADEIDPGFATPGPHPTADEIDPHFGESLAEPPTGRLWFPDSQKPPIDNPPKEPTKPTE